MLVVPPTRGDLLVTRLLSLWAWNKGALEVHSLFSKESERQTQNVLSRVMAFLLDYVLLMNLLIGSSGRWIPTVWLMCILLTDSAEPRSVTFWHYLDPFT